MGGGKRHITDRGDRVSEDTRGKKHQATNVKDLWADRVRAAHQGTRSGAEGQGYRTEPLMNGLSYRVKGCDFNLKVMRNWQKV